MIWRILAAIVWFLVASLMAMLLLPFRWRNPTVGHVFAKLLHTVGLRIFGLKVMVHNPERMDQRPCVYVANHQSNLDIFTMSTIYPPDTVVIGKKELKWLPLFGWLFAGAGNVMIDRKNRTHSLSGFDDAAKAVRQRGLSVWIFPEGTRNRGSAEMLPFKKGAFHLAVRAQIPIVPIVHQHLHRYFDYDKHWFNHKDDVHIQVLEPVTTAGLGVGDIETLMATVRSKMDEVLKQPLYRPEPLAPASSKG